MSTQSPIPDFFDSQKVGTTWRVPYEERAKQARDWARSQQDIHPASADSTRTWLMLIDVQNTFCIPDFELYVGGRSGRGAVEDNVRLCEFIYRNLGTITRITATMDTHRTMQVFHAIFFVDKDDNHPAPYTDIHVSDLRDGKWTFNAALASQFGIAPEYGQQMMIHYAEKLQKTGKYALTIWFELPGTFEMLLLKALSLGAMHGWGVAERIERLSGGACEIQQGAVYPALQRLLRRGWVAGEHSEPVTN